ncbi:MAG: hypothetical protein V1861_06120 [Candidatus Micrarchaeota archaeon]
MNARTVYPREKTQKEVGMDTFSSVGYARWYKSRRCQPLNEGIVR